MLKMSITDELDALGKSLIKEAKSSTTDLSDRIAVFSNIVKWVAIKHKIEPDGEEGEQISKYQRILDNNSGRKNSAGRRKPARKDTPETSEPKPDENIIHDLGDFADSKPAFGGFPIADGGFHPKPNGGN